MKRSGGRGELIKGRMKAVEEEVRWKAAKMKQGATKEVRREDMKGREKGMKVAG